MQDTLFVRCRRGMNGRLWPTRRRWGRRGVAGDLKPDAARTSPRSAGAPMGSVEAPAGRVINACAWSPAMPLRQRAGASAKRCGDRRIRFDRRPRTGAGTTCGRRGGIGVNDALNLRSGPGFAASDRDVAA